MDFALPQDYKLKLKESEKGDKYLDIAGELKKLRSIRITVVPIINGALGTVSKGLQRGLHELEIGGRIETIKTAELLKLAWMLQ